jgi:hypothetical protein
MINAGEVHFIHQAWGGGEGRGEAVYRAVPAEEAGQPAQLTAGSVGTCGELSLTDRAHASLS